MGVGKILGKTIKGVANVSGEVVEGLGHASIKAAEGTFKAGKFASKPFIRNIKDAEKVEAGFAGSLMPKRLTGLGVFAVGAGTMAVSTGKEISNSGMTKFNKLGDISVGENLDRLISYDGSGFVDGVNNISQGDPEVMQDMVKNTFSSVNQYGASGDLVFALHNRRQG